MNTKKHSIAKDVGEADSFRDRIQKEVDSANEDGKMEDWELYEHLKSFIPVFQVDHETAIKIITETAGL